MLLKNAYPNLPKTVNVSVNQVLVISLIAIGALKDQLRLFKKVIEEQMQVISTTLTSAKIIVPIYATGIIAGIGDNNRLGNRLLWQSPLVNARANTSPASIPLIIHTLYLRQTVI